MDISSKPTWEEVAITASRQRDELRADNKRLLETWVTLSEENERLRAEVRGLTETIEDWQQTHGTFTANAAAILIEDECDADD